MTTLTALTIKNCSHEGHKYNVCRAYYSDETSLIISKSNADDLSRTYNIRIETESEGHNISDVISFKEAGIKSITFEGKKYSA